MIQKGSILRVIDNSGIILVRCIDVPTGYRRRYAYLGDLINVSVQTLKSKRRSSKIKKGDILKAVIIRTCLLKKNCYGESFKYFENAVILLSRQKKFLGTRIFGAISKIFRYSKFKKTILMSSGFCL